MAGEEPDVVIGCCGRRQQLRRASLSPSCGKKSPRGKKYRIVAVEPASCPSLTKGELRYDFGDTAEHDSADDDVHPRATISCRHRFTPAGCAITACRPCQPAYKLGLIEAVAYPQTTVFEAAVLFARTEGLVPAPESSHAIRAAVDEAIKAREEGRKKVILFNLCGHGLLDLASYDNYLTGQLQDE